MLSMLLIGMSSFGNMLCKNLAKYDNQIMIVDKNEEKMRELIPLVTASRIGDCTNPEVIKALGVSNFDIIFVCIGSSFQDSLEVTSLVDEYKRPDARVISLAERKIQENFLLKNGATEVVFPDRMVAENLARSASDNKVFDYIELSAGYGIYEIPIMNAWNGKSIRDINVRAQYNISILGTKNIATKEKKLMPSPDYIFTKEEHLLVMSAEKEIDKLLELVDNN